MHRVWIHRKQADQQFDDMWVPFLVRREVIGDKWVNSIQSEWQFDDMWVPTVNGRHEMKLIIVAVAFVRRIEMAMKREGWGDPSISSARGPDFDAGKYDAEPIAMYDGGCHTPTCTLPAHGLDCHERLFKEARGV